MEKVYMKIVLGHPSFSTGKICIVELPMTCAFINTYVEVAKRKACEKLGFNEKEVVVLDWTYLGEDVFFIN